MPWKRSASKASAPLLQGRVGISGVAQVVQFGGPRHARPPGVKVERRLELEEQVALELLEHGVVDRLRVWWPPRDADGVVHDALSRWRADVLGDAARGDPERGTVRSRDPPGIGGVGERWPGRRVAGNGLGGPRGRSIRG